MRRSVRPVRTPATQTAQAPVPQARVMPEPALPGPHADLARAEDLDEVGVHPARERRVMLEAQGRAPRAGNRSDIRRRRSPRAGCPSRRRSRPASGRRPWIGASIGGSPGRRVGISAAFKIGAPMSTRTRRTLPPSTSRSSVRTPRPVSTVTASLPGQAVVVDVLGHAADAVAAHLRLGAVGVEHPHPRVGPLRGHDQDQAVGADAEMPVADRHRQPRGIGRSGTG